MRNLFYLTLPKFSLFALFIKKPTAIIVAASATVAISTVVSFEGVAWILFIMFFCDLASGLGASYCIWKKSAHNERWFFGKGEGFSSDKFKKCFVKAIVYLGLPYLLIRFQQVLMLKNIKYERLSDAEFEWATIALIVFCLCEGFSIFHENLPECGFNLWHQIKKMIGFYKEAKKEITE